MREDEMVGWHHGLSGHESEQVQEMVKDRGTWRAGVRGFAESDTSKRLNNDMQGATWSVLLSPHQRMATTKMALVVLPFSASLKFKWASFSL